MCKEMPVIPVNRVVDKEKNNGEKWRVEEQERHKGLLPPPLKMPYFVMIWKICGLLVHFPNFGCSKKKIWQHPACQIFGRPCNRCKAGQMLHTPEEK
jgi:hypothetical protein